jgi:hypothetical protein
MVSEAVERQFAERGVEMISPDAGRRLFVGELRHGDRRDVEVVLGRGPWATADSIPAEPVPAEPPPAMPLVTAVVPGTGGTIECTPELDVARHLYLDDHRLDDRPVLPAAMAAALMAETVQQGWPDRRVAGLRAFRLFRGVVLENGAKRIRVSARPMAPLGHTEADVEVDVAIHEQGAMQPAYRGTVVLAADATPAPRFAMPPVGNLVPFPLDARTAYREWLFHGPRFQCIRELRGIGPGGIVATVQASDPSRCLAGATAARWLIDPILLDAGPQLAILWARHVLGMTALPAQMAAVRRFAAAEPGAMLTCHFAIDPASDRHRLVANVSFVAADGRLVLSVEGLTCTSSHALNRLAVEGVEAQAQEPVEP